MIDTKKFIEPIVSVIVPTHNRAEMLKRAIKSVLAQTWKGEFELIIVSDGSNDNTEEIVQSFEDSRIRFLKHENIRGASAARNTGLRKAKGEYIAFLDDDDEWMSNKLEVQMPVIENSRQEIGLVYAWMEYFRDGKSDHVNMPDLRGDVFVEMLDKQAIGGCPTIIIKKEVIDKVGYFDETLLRGNDGNYWRRISKHFHVDYVPEVLAKINIGHGDRLSLMNSPTSNRILAYEKRLKIYSVEFDKHQAKKMNVLLYMGHDYLCMFEIKCAISCFLKASQCQVQTKIKLLLFLRTVLKCLQSLLRNIWNRPFFNRNTITLM